MNISLGRRATGGGQHGIVGGAHHGIQRFLDNASTYRASRDVHELLERDADRVWFWRSLQLEVERTRRHDGEFTVVCIVHPRDSQTAATAALIAPHLRATDAITAEHDRVLILLSDTVASGAKSAVDRLAGFADPAAANANWCDVVFPRDALTFHGLVECLRRPDPGRQMPLAG